MKIKNSVVIGVVVTFSSAIQSLSYIRLSLVVGPFGSSYS